MTTAMSVCQEEDAVSIVSATTQNSDETQTDILMVKPKEIKQEDMNTDLVVEVDGQLSDFVTPASPVLPVYDESQAQEATSKMLPLNNSLCNQDEDVDSGDCSQMSEVLIPLKQTTMNTEHRPQSTNTDTVEPSQSLLPITSANEQMHNESINEEDGQHLTSAGTEAVNVEDKMKSPNEEMVQTRHSGVEHGPTEHLSTKSKRREQLHIDSKASFEQHDLRNREQVTHTYSTRSLVQPQSRKFKKRKYDLYSDCSDSCCIVEQKKSKASCTRVNLNTSGRSVKKTGRTSESEGQVSSQFTADRNSDEVNRRIGKLLNTIEKLPARQQEVVKTTVEHCIVKLQDNLEKGLSQTLNMIDRPSYIRLKKLVQIIQSNLTRVMCFYKRCEKDGTVTYDQPCLFDMHVQHKKNLLSIVQRQKNLVKQFKARDRDKPEAHVSNSPRYNTRAMGLASEMFTAGEMKQQTNTQKDTFDFTDEVNVRVPFEGDGAKKRKPLAKVVKDFEYTQPVRTSIRSQITSGNDILIETDNNSSDTVPGKQTYVWSKDNTQLPYTVGTKSELSWLNMLHSEENKKKHSQSYKVQIPETMRDDCKPDRQYQPGVDSVANDGVNIDDIFDGQHDDDYVSDNESIDILTATKVTHCTPSLNESLATDKDRKIGMFNIPIDSYRSDDEGQLLEDKKCSTKNIVDQDLHVDNLIEINRQGHTAKEDSIHANDRFNEENNYAVFEQQQESLFRQDKNVGRLAKNSNSCKEIGEKVGQDVKHAKFLSSSSSYDSQPLQGQTSPTTCRSSDVFAQKPKSLDTQKILGMQTESIHRMVPGQIDVDIEDLELQDTGRCRYSQRPAHQFQTICEPVDNVQLPPFRGININGGYNSENKQDHRHLPTCISDTKSKITESKLISNKNTVQGIKPEWSQKTNVGSLYRLDTHSPGPYQVMSGRSLQQAEKHSIEPCQVISSLKGNHTTYSDPSNSKDLYESEQYSEFHRKSDNLPTWKELIAENRIVPGQNVLSVQIKGITSHASLTQNGKIHDSRGLWFNSPAKWLSSLVGGQTIKKMKAYELVMYKGKTIQAICRTQHDKLADIRVDQTTKMAERRHSQRDQITQTEVFDATITDTRVLKTYDKHLNDVLSSSVIHLISKKDLVSCEDLPNNFWFEDFAKVKLYKSMWNSVTCW